MSYSLNDKQEAFEPIKRHFDSNKRAYGVTIGIHAPHRTGKTLTAVALCIYYLFNLSYIKGIISNTNIFLNNLKTDLSDRFIPLQDIKIIKDNEYKSYIIFTDEIRRLVDSRMSTSFRNKFISNLLADTGKFRQIHIFTDQDGSAVDRRVRLNTDAVLYPIMDKQRKICRVKSFPNYSTYFWYERNGIINDWKIEFYFQYEPYFNLYNTEQKIEDYIIKFTPQDYALDFIDWIKKMGYHKLGDDFKITKSTLILWKETEGIEIGHAQLSALYEFIKLEVGMKRLGLNGINKSNNSNA